MKIFCSYISKRELIVHSVEGSSIIRSVTGGVPQVSILGPTSWNIFSDDLLGIEVPPGVQLIDFADDLAVLVVARTTPKIEEVVNPTLANVNDWISQHGLLLVHHKTEAIVLSRKRNYQLPELSVGGHAIEIKKIDIYLKYLGVTLDSHMTFSTAKFSCYV